MELGVGHSDLPDSWLGTTVNVGPMYGLDTGSPFVGQVFGVHFSKPVSSDWVQRRLGAAIWEERRLAHTLQDRIVFGDRLW